MRLHAVPLSVVSVLLVLVISVLLSLRYRNQDPIKMATLGGVHESQGGAAQNSVEIEGVARFAVDEHNKKEVSILIFV